uniref:GntR family transcriptional regulator n=1 Tax=uncultured Thiotrichaceae bacterium TaxID=298394 RepID=A0A6S6SJQ9_9GAMM|nr:MAG: GntR family transcriptional regulator [uncultured Thiotrichaceae bacterium]
MVDLKDNTISELLSEATLNPKEGLVQQIYVILMDHIVNIRLKPGQAMSEKEISDSLKASKTPVREALIKLEDTGLVRIVPKSGTYVSPISIERYIEACFTRTQLEIGAVRRAAERSNNLRSVLNLESIISKQVQALEAGEGQLFFQEDQALHKAFFTMAGIPGIWELVKKTQADVNRIRHLKRLYNIRREAQVIDEHKAIVAAIRSGSPDDAETALIQHIGSLETEIDTLSSHPELLDYIETLNASGKRRKQAR